MQVTNALPYILPAYKIEARATETPGRFDLALDGTASKAIPCEDFLAHTDRLQPRFEAIIQASRRPGTFLAGDYSDPRRIPVLNPALKYADDCVQLRMQAHLWLDEYDKAAQDLAAFNALHKLAPPSDLSLAQAESNIARPYHTFVMIQSGFARHGWGSGHVETLIEFAQGQRPLRTFAKGFQNDQLRPVWLMENHFETNAMGSSLMSALRLSGSANEYALWDYMPGGWIRQSMANHIRPMLVLSDCYDGTRGVVSPEKFSSASKTWTAN